MYDFKILKFNVMLKKLDILFLLIIIPYERSHLCVTHNSS